jgi:hypothetical protein
MSEEDYARRDNTYRKYKEAKIKEDPTWTLEKEMCIRRGKRGGCRGGGGGGDTGHMVLAKIKEDPTWTLEKEMCTGT